MKTKVCILSACLFFFLAYTGLTTITERLNDNGAIELSDKVLDSVIGGYADSVCWNQCPQDEGTESSCESIGSCSIASDCPGGDASQTVEAGDCTTSNNMQHTCNPTDGEWVLCGSGWFCWCCFYRTCDVFTMINDELWKEC